MVSAAPPLDQLYKLTRDRLEVVLDGESLLEVDALEAWVRICEDLHAIDADRNPRRLAASVYRVTQQLVLAADGTPPGEVATLARLCSAGRRAHDLLVRLGG
ncbi:MAG: hypothetical protein M3Y71_03265 [Actinomycetota bacterium]|nr:hypothetical protein [Actinomycetota bacterium]